MGEPGPIVPGQLMYHCPISSHPLVAIVAWVCDILAAIGITAGLYELAGARNWVFD